MSKAKRGGRTRSGNTSPRAATRETAARQRAGGGRGTFLSDYARRVDAAGLGRDQPAPTTVDGMRNAMARKIAMVMNEWRGCREPLCRRMRGCMAPRIGCSNRKERRPRTERQVARDMARLMRHLRAAAKAADGGTGV